MNYHSIKDNTNILQKPKLTEWKLFEDYIDKKKIIAKIKSKKLAAVMKTGLNTWYCEYKNKDDYTGKILFIKPPFWTGISFPNDQLKEAIKGLIYHAAGDKYSASVMVIEYCQKVPGNLVFEHHSEDYTYKLECLNECIIDDYGSMDGKNTKYSIGVNKQDKLIDELNEWPDKTTSHYVPSKSMLMKYYEEKEEEYTEKMSFNDYCKEVEERGNALISIRKELRHYIRDSKEIQALFPFTKKFPELCNYKDIKGVCIAYSADDIISRIKEKEYFYFEIMSGREDKSTKSLS